MAYQQRSSSGRRSSGRYQQKQSGGFASLLLFYILPFLVFNGILFYCVITAPKAVLSVADTNDYLSTEVSLTIKSWFPVKSVSLTLDGEPLELFSSKRHVYTTTVSRNGSLEANIVNANGMPAQIFDRVNVLDDNPPSIKNSDIQDGIITLIFEDSQSGINVDSIYALNSAGIQLSPLTIDRSTCTFSYEMDASGLHVYAQDMAGNEIHGSYTSHRQGDVEMLEGGVDDIEAAAEAPLETEAASDAETSAESNVVIQ